MRTNSYQNRITPKRFPQLYGWLSANGLTLKWLSDETGIGYNSLHDKLKMRTKITREDIDAICKVTGMTEEELRKDETVFSQI